MSEIAPNYPRLTQAELEAELIRGGLPPSEAKLHAALDAAEARVRVLESALERIAKSSPYRYGTLHPDACAQVARAALDTGGRG